MSEGQAAPAAVTPSYRPMPPRPGSDMVHAGHQMLKTKPKPNTQWERQRATRSVAHHAQDAEDCTLLLDMLGLTVADGQETSIMRSVSRKKGTVPDNESRGAS